MQESSSIPRSTEDSAIAARAEVLFENARQAVFVKVDRLFVVLLIVQWLAAILTSIFISPLAWEGTQSSVHIHVLTAIILGAIITIFPVLTVFSRPGSAMSRHSIAMAQTFYSALFIHLSGGRIETHFHVFGSLALLAFYRDWKVLITALLVVAGDHSIRSFCWPQSVYGIAYIDPFRWVEHTLWVVFEEVFLVISCVVTTKEMHSIAERQAELESMNQLKEQEARFRTLCNLSPLGIFQADVRGNCTFVNQRWEAITGLNQEQSSGTKWYSVIHGNERKKFDEAWQNMVQTGDMLALELQITVKGRETRWVNILANAVRDDDGTSKMFVGSIEDITESKQARLKTENLAQIVELTSDAVYCWDLDGTITSWNEGACNLYDYDAAEMIGTKVSKLFLQSCAETDMSTLKTMVLSGSLVKDFECQRVNKAGQVINVSITASPLTDEFGTITGISIIARDITERKDSEKRISEFYSTISHELRTPLTSIRGALALMDEGLVDPASEEGRELIQIGHMSSIRLIRLINEVLDFRKIEAGQLEVHPVRVNPEKIVLEALASMRGMATEMNIKLETQINTKLDLEADPDRITQVLVNLISNALKFSEDGTRVLVNVFDLKLEKENFVRFAVVDQGPGITPEFQGKLFRKFQQLDSSDSRSKEGTGLGLAISKAIVNAHCGAISMQNNIDCGSTFYFDLPAHAVPIKIGSMQEIPDIPDPSGERLTCSARK